MAILTDTTLCTGCEECVKSCKEVNELGPDVPRRWKLNVNDLSSTRFTTILHRKGDRSIRQLCRHCLEPACASACLVGALQKTKEGPVTYDSDRCIGCRYCMAACPFEIPRYDWEKAVPYVRKCTMCYDRLEEGKLPGCVEACPHEATIFGTREELIAEAHRRIEAAPDKYVHEVVGETEVGGTSVLYISDIPLGFLAAKPGLEEQPLPELTWAALSKVPPLVVGMAGLMTGFWWITGRRNKLAEEARQEAAAREAAEKASAEPAPKPEENDTE